MAIQSSDIAFRLSGGATNNVPGASLGGAMSSNAVNAAVLFDTVTGAESASGDIEYRCEYVFNSHATLTMQNTVAWLAANTANTSTTIEIGIGTAAIGGNEQSVANESTAPSGVTFSAAASVGAALALGNIPPQSGRSIWLRRTIIAGSPASSDSATVRVTCDTAE